MPCNSVEITFWNARIDPLKRFSRMALFTALTCLAVPVAAQEFRASNHMTVTPLSDGSFEVSGRAELWARDFWCAAGEYGRRVLDLPVTARIAVTAPYDKARRTVVFGPVPDAEPQFRVVIMGLSIRNAGESLSVGQANGFCADYKLRSSH